MLCWELNEENAKDLPTITTINKKDLNSLVIVPTGTIDEDSGYPAFRVVAVGLDGKCIGIGKEKRDLLSFVPDIALSTIKIDMLPSGLVRIFTSDNFKKWRLY